LATILSHPAVPAGIALALGQKRVPRQLLIAGMFCSIAADFDTVGMAMGIPYESQWGHRGFTHSIVAALALAGFWAWAERKTFGVKPAWAFVYLFISAISHPIIDAMTDGGLGIAFFWPFSVKRYFFPFNPIPVSPIGQSFISERGLHVFSTELWELWLPCLTVGGLGFLVRKFMGRQPAEGGNNPPH
jgi:inner membrane protein